MSEDLAADENITIPATTIRPAAAGFGIAVTFLPPTSGLQTNNQPRYHGYIAAWDILLPL